MTPLGSEGFPGIMKAPHNLIADKFDKGDY